MEQIKFHCPMDVAMTFIGGKWKVVVLWYLIEEERRFSELKKLVPGITEKMLSLQLKSLEADGIIKRTVYTSKPPLKVEYSFTEFGKSLIPVLKAIGDWGYHTANVKSLKVAKSSRPLLNDFLKE